MTEPTDDAGAEQQPPAFNPPPAYNPPPQVPPAAPPTYGSPPPPAAPPAYGSPPPPGAAPAYGSPPAAAPFVGYQVAIPEGMWFDQASGLVLPNGVTLATHGRRVGAWFLSILLVVVTLVIGYIIWGAIAWGHGQTPTQQVLGMRTWRPAENRVASWGIMALREIVGRIAEGILSILSLLISFILFLSSNKRQCLHDLVGGTVVLYDPQKILG